MSSSPSTCTTEKRSGFSLFSRLLKKKKPAQKAASSSSSSLDMDNGADDSSSPNLSKAFSFSTMSSATIESTPPSSHTTTATSEAALSRPGNRSSVRVVNRSESKNFKEKLNNRKSQAYSKTSWQSGNEEGC